VTYHLDDARRFQNAPVRPAGRAARVIFTGTMVLNRHECVEDLLDAMDLLRRKGRDFELEVYCTGLPKELSRETRTNPAVRFLPLPSHDDLPGILKSADVLLLAISTKCHLYMMAERPILAYGPSYGGTMEYARRHGWALVVDERNTAALADALERLIEEPALAVTLTQQARECFGRNHDVHGARERFEGLVADSVGSATWG
jgi:glycosyltransferase involved in cell wall biosynthesis